MCIAAERTVAEDARLRSLDPASGGANGVMGVYMETTLVPTVGGLQRTRWVKGKTPLRDVGRKNFPVRACSSAEPASWALSAHGGRSEKGRWQRKSAGRQATREPGRPVTGGSGDAAPESGASAASSWPRAQRRWMTAARTTTPAASMTGRATLRASPASPPAPDAQATTGP